MLNWDRSHDFVLLRWRRDLTSITIRFQTSSPSVAELIALRRFLPRFRDMAPRAVREMIGHSQELRLDALPTPEAILLIEEAEREGLDVHAEQKSFTGYQPYDRTIGCAWLIENGDEAAAVVQTMIAEGVQVQDSIS
jgi:hypothetical protein